jgi:UDP-glucose:(heptosyl)LPS alpha-1,3-glucosyltransferase
MSGPSPVAIRLAVIRRRYAPYGGAERFIERSLDELLAMGIQPALVCAEWDNRPGVEPGWEVVRLGAPRGLSRARKELDFERAVRALLATRHFDLVQSHERIPGLAVFRAGDGLHCEWLRQRRRIQSKAAQWLTRLDPYHRFSLERERQLFDHPGLRIVICNSEMVRSEIAEHFPQARSKVRVIRNGIDASQFAPASEAQRLAARQRLGIRPDLPTVVHVGSGFERKGVATVLRVAALLPQVQFLLAGHDKKIESYRREARRLQVAPRVFFVGATPDVASCLDAGDMFIFPTLYDPGPNAVLEAMAKGLPVLTSQKCGLAELLVPAGAGCAHDALDAQAFAASVVELLDPGRRSDMGRAAHEVALGLGLGKLAASLRQLYEELLH